MVSFYFLGVKFTVSIGFLCLVTAMLYIDKSGLLLPALEAVLLHECGHIVALKLQKANIENVYLKVGCIGIEGRYNLTLKGEIIMLLSGSAINIFCGICYYSGYLYFDKILLLNRFIIMFSVGIFNLFPIIGLDGGDLLYILISRLFGLEIAAVIIKVISIIFISLLFVLGVAILKDTENNPSLLLLSAYLYVCTFKKI